MVRANQRYISNGNQWRAGTVVVVDSVRKAGLKNRSRYIAPDDKLVWFVLDGDNTNTLEQLHVEDFEDGFTQV